MEKIAVLLIPVLLTVVLVRLLLIPMRAGFRLGIHSVGGFLCLWLLNTASGFTGIFLPINAATVLIAGCLGLPGIGLMALLEIVPL